MLRLFPGIEAGPGFIFLELETNNVLIHPFTVLGIMYGRIFMRLRPFLVLTLCVGYGCNKEEENTEIITYTPMESVEALHRVSLALRGVRPSQQDIDAVLADSGQLSIIADGYTASEEFVDTIRDMYAERLRMRAIGLILPNVGELAGTTTTQRQWALSEEPLDIIAEVVRYDEPFGNIVTADWTVLDEMSSLIWAGHTYNTAAGGKQVVSFTDGRDPAGILTAGSYLVRHESNGANYHRSRANTIADTMLCASFSGRDIPITGDIDLSDDDAVADALNNNTECVGCHQIVDPLAANHWNYRSRLTPFQVATAYNQEEPCDPSLPRQFSCYPVSMYTPGNIIPGLEARGLRLPGYYGAETSTMSDVGALIAEDPRFAQCAAKTFASYLTQTPIDGLDAKSIARYQQVFSESNQSAQALAHAIVTDDTFLSMDVSGTDAPRLAGVQVVRPEQMERMIYSWSDFRVEYGISRNGYGDTRFFLDDGLGFRAMSGGVDGNTVTSPTHTPTPVKLLAFGVYAEESAGFIVESEFKQPVSGRTIFTDVEATDTEESVIRQQIAVLHLRLFGLTADEQSESVTALYDLWKQTAQASSAKDAWSVSLTAMLQSPDLLFY